MIAICNSTVRWRYNIQRLMCVILRYVVCYEVVEKDKWTLCETRMFNNLDFIFLTWLITFEIRVRRSPFFPIGRFIADNRFASVPFVARLLKSGLFSMFLLHNYKNYLL